MDPQDRFDSFLAYLEDSVSLSPDQKRKIETRIEAFRPYQSVYLPAVFPGGLHFFYADDRLACAEVMKKLFHGGRLKISLSKKSQGWQTLQIDNPDFFVLDLIYSYKNNIDNLPGVIIINKIADKIFENEYIINKLNKIKKELVLLNSINDNSINKLVNILDEVIDNIYSKSDIISKEIRRGIKREYKGYNIVRHLAMVFKCYISKIGSNVLCKRIEELLALLYHQNNYNFNMIKKDLQRHNLL